MTNVLATAVPTPTVPRALPGILVLDDDPFMLDLLARMLSDMGYANVSTASHAEAALAVLLQHPEAVDMVICDLNMPGMDGIEFLQRLNVGPFRGSAILLSGEGLRIMHTVRKLLQGGRLAILGTLEKPAKKADLKLLLDAWTPRAQSAPARPRPRVSANELHLAIREDQLVLHYQPKIDLRTGELAGMEALVRWNHPEQGLVYPDDFISVAEDCGAINALTEWVLKNSIRQLVRWHAEGLKIRMAINVSMDNLRSPCFVQRVSAFLRESGAAPQDITLEITESRLISPSPTPLQSLVRLRLMRFALSIDDFGTGHSSLAQLRDVPFTELKVDRSFVNGARHNQIIRPMLEGSLGIAQRMGMQTVAEGVETEEDWHLLRELGCDYAQGYFIAKPMTSDCVPAWMSAWQARLAALAVASGIGVRHNSFTSTIE